MARRRTDAREIAQLAALGISPADIEELIGLARAEDRYNERVCSVEMSEDRQAREDRLSDKREARVIEIVSKTPGLRVRVNGDPRGYPFYVLVPSGDEQGYPIPIGR